MDNEIFHVKSDNITVTRTTFLNAVKVMMADYYLLYIAYTSHIHATMPFVYKVTISIPETYKNVNS